MTPDIAEAIARIEEEATVVAELAFEYTECHSDPEHYGALLGKPRSVTWAQWSEQQCEVLRDDLLLRLDGLLQLRAAVA